MLSSSDAVLIFSSSLTSHHFQLPESQYFFHCQRDTIKHPFIGIIKETTIFSTGSSKTVELSTNSLLLRHDTMWTKKNNKKNPSYEVVPE